MGNRPRVLVVDDSFEMAKTISDGLTDREFDAIPGGSGHDAVARLTT